MSEIHTLQNIILYIDGLTIKSILECRAITIPNQHFKAKLKFNLEEDLQPNEIEELIYHRIAQLLEINANGEISDTPLFSGIIEDYSIIKKGIYTEIEINIISGTILLDIEYKSRSFQNINMGYKDIIKYVLSDIENTSMIFNKEDKKILKPIIQYEETNWEFIKRLASHFNTYVIPETNFFLPRFYFGIKKGQDVIFNDVIEYNLKFDNQYYKKEFLGSEEKVYKKDFFYYEVVSKENFSVGDNTYFQDFKLKIIEKETYLLKGELLNKYKLGSENFFAPKEYYNKKMVGLNLLGTVLETKGELIKVHLDIDNFQDISTAYFYTWRPETGNLMYLIPEVNTKVILHSINEDERNCILINSIHKQHSTKTNYNNRNLTTKYNKQLLIYPEKLEMISNTTNHFFSIQDASGIYFNSENLININAGGDIIFDGDNSVEVNVPNEIEIDYIVIEKIGDFDEFKTNNWSV